MKTTDIASLLFKLNKEGNKSISNLEIVTEGFGLIANTHLTIEMPVYNYSEETLRFIRKIMDREYNRYV